MEPAVHSPNGPVLQTNRRCAVRTGLFYSGTMQRCTLRTVGFYSQIGGALSELGCSIIEPAALSPNGPVLGAALYALDCSIVEPAVYSPNRPTAE